MKKAILIGPVYPYKGGISHYTGMMYRTLAQKYEVTMVSYKLQYPKLLFKKEQKDYTNDSFKISNTNYWIHTANPVNWILTAKKIQKMIPELIVIQWWHPYFAPCYFILGKLLKRSRILFVCHNVFPHERFPLDRWLTKITLKQGNAFVLQSGSDVEDLLKIVPNAYYEQTVHPTYNAFKFESMLKVDARKLLGIKEEEKIILFFGFVREYKGLKYLIRAMPEVTNRYPETRLLVVGDFDGNKNEYEEMIKECGVTKFTEIYDGYIPDREVEKYFAACDLVVLPYESATQSGIVQIAYGFEKPVIVTNVGGLPDVVEDGKTGYVVEAKNSGSIAESILKYFTECREQEMTENVKKEAYRFSWDRMLEVLIKLETDKEEIYD